METEKLNESFFARNSDIVAKELLGKYVVRVLNNNRIVRGKITGIAAYQGKSERTSSKIKSAPGKISVSTKYGNHLLDISTGNEGEYSCVTLRAAEFDWVNEKQSVEGPGKLCKALGLDKSLDNLSVYNDKLWIEKSDIGNLEVIVEKSGSMPSNCLGYYKLKK